MEIPQFDGRSCVTWPEPRNTAWIVSAAEYLVTVGGSSSRPAGSRGLGAPLEWMGGAGLQACIQMCRVLGFSPRGTSAAEAASEQQLQCSTKALLHPKSKPPKTKKPAERWSLDRVPRPPTYRVILSKLKGPTSRKDAGNGAPLCFYLEDQWQGLKKWNGLGFTKQASSK
jgi:hypothetical protein